MYSTDSEALGGRIKWGRRNDTNKFLSVFESEYSVSVNNIDRQTVPQRRCSDAERSLGKFSAEVSWSALFAQKIKEHSTAWRIYPCKMTL